MLKFDFIIISMESRNCFQLIRNSIEICAKERSNEKKMFLLNTFSNQINRYQIVESHSIECISVDVNFPYMFVCHIQTPWYDRISLKRVNLIMVKLVSNDAFVTHLIVIMWQW